MNYIKNTMIVLAILVVITTPVMAQEQLSKPGIKPNSPFYFMDKMFDVFQSAESVADERAAEMVAMAQISNEKGLEKAREGYEKVMAKRQRQAEKDELVAEEVARQSSNHLIVLSQVRENASEQARQGLNKALNESVTRRDRALQSLNESNSNRARIVAQATLQEVIANAPDAAQEGLQRAMEAVRSRREIQGDNANGNMTQERENAPVVRGQSSNRSTDSDEEINGNVNDETEEDSENREEDYAPEKTNNNRTSVNVSAREQ